MAVPVVYSTLATFLNQTDVNENWNGTTESPGPKPPYWDLHIVIILSTILFIVMTISIIGNALIILVMVFFKGMRSKTNMFITNLACADFGVSLLCMPFSLATVIHGDWGFGPVLCNINAFFEALFLVASTHGLMVIALHKFFSLVMPLRRLINRRRAIYMIMYGWFIGFTCAIGPIVGLTENQYKPGTSQCGPKYPEKLTEKLIGIYVPAVGIVIPLLCLIITYSVIFKTIRSYSQRLRKNTNMAEERIFNQQVRITVTLFIVFVAFFICWSPYFIYSTLGLSMGFHNVPTILNVAAYWSGYTNSALNPLIYAWRTRSYRKAFKRIFCCDIQGGMISDTGTANNGEFASPSMSRRHQLIHFGQGTLPGSKTTSLSSLMRPSPVTSRQTPQYQALLEVNGNHLKIPAFSRNGHALNHLEGSSEEDDDINGDSGSMRRRSNSEGDKDSLAMRHYDLPPQSRDRFLSDPGQNIKQSDAPAVTLRHPDALVDKQCIVRKDWEPDDKARRALLARSTVV
ncbi:histamine H2 receptor-like isoform X1 [Asterias amurensis]|uniref:histamine H2 receptor-like isoform X1 n=1 Tax=Asterias amurensis TaxID=7602 RepID=UPI003AB759DA